MFAAWLVPDGVLGCLKTRLALACCFAAASRLLSSVPLHDSAPLTTGGGGGSAVPSPSAQAGGEIDAVGICEAVRRRACGILSDQGDRDHIRVYMGWPDGSGFGACWKLLCLLEHAALWMFSPIALRIGYVMP